MMINIPAIDLINGNVVRLTKGEFDKQTSYDTDPVSLAKLYEDGGASHIHIIDLDAARGQGSNAEIIYNIAKHTSLQVQTGGGIRTKTDVVRALENGVQSVIVGSKAVTAKEDVVDWIDSFGAETIILGADVRGDKIATDGWYNTSDITIASYIHYYVNHGATTFLCTDIAKDGTLTGPSFVLYRSLLERFESIKLIASGGIATIRDLKQLSEDNLYAAVIGKALLENKITLQELNYDA